MDINKLKEIQSEVKRKSRIINIFWIIIWLISLVMLYLIIRADITFYFIDSMVMLVIGLLVRNIILGKDIKEFNGGFKSIFVASSLKKIFTNLEYFPDRGLDESVIGNTGMMNMGDRYSSNDYFEATYKDVKVRQADVHIEEEQETTDSDGNTHTTWVTIFKGKWMIFDFNKVFSANIQVSQKGFGNNRIYLFGNNKYKKIEMEDLEFNKMFRTYAQNEHDAFYVLTPALMEKIKKLTKNIKGKILLCFINNELHVGLYNNADSFEHSVYKDINEDEINDKISSDIKVITNFIDDLNLDNNLFRKGV